MSQRHNGDGDAAIGAIFEGSVQEPETDISTPSVPSNSTHTGGGSQSKSILPYDDNAAFRQASSNSRANARQGWHHQEGAATGTGEWQWRRFAKQLRKLWTRLIQFDRVRRKGVRAWRRIGIAFSVVLSGLCSLVNFACCLCPFETLTPQTFILF